jgi:1-acyl-sn-glycerol-3-phosphate acyltransferase
MKRFFFALWYLPIFVVFTVIAGLICIALSFFSKATARVISSQGWGYIVLDPAFIKVEVIGKENLPDPSDGGYIIYANHRSLLDIPIAGRASGRKLSWVAKAALGRIPVFGWTLKRIHMLVDRGGGPDAARQMVTEAVSRLNSGEILAIFPEGTRNKTQQPILPFKKGAFILAKHNGAKLVPMAIHNSGNLWPSGSFVPKPGIVKVAIGRPITTSKSTTLNQISAEAQKVLEDLYNKLEHADKNNLQ